MAKTKSSSSVCPLFLAAIITAVLPLLAAQSPASAPMLPVSPVAPGPDMSMAPSPGLDCFSYLIQLSDCLTFVETGSNLTKPDAGCCPELAKLVDTQPICLCQLLGNPGQVGLTVDVNRALKLPNVCNVTTPPVSLCAAIGIPIGAPTTAPSPAPSDVRGGSVATSPSSMDGGMSGNSGSSSSTGNLSSKQQFLIGIAALLSAYFF